jgi:hypothetical protein
MILSNCLKYASKLFLFPSSCHYRAAVWQIYYILVYFKTTLTLFFPLEICVRIFRMGLLLMSLCKRTRAFSSHEEILDMFVPSGVWTRLRVSNIKFSGKRSPLIFFYTYLLLAVSSNYFRIFLRNLTILAVLCCMGLQLQQEPYWCDYVNVCFS